MNPDSSSESRCPACGTSTQLASEDSLCPGCLLGAALTRGHMDEEPAAPAFEECDGYTLEKIIGRGGYGVVFLARRAGSSLPFALKMLASAQLAGPDEIRRFRFEAESVFQLNHRHIVRVVDIGEHEGAPYFVMDYAEGGNLAEKLDHAFDPTAAETSLVDHVQLTVKVARAIDRALDLADDRRGARHALLHVARTSSGRQRDHGHRPLQSRRDPFPDAHRTDALRGRLRHRDPAESDHRGRAGSAQARRLAGPRPGDDLSNSPAPRALAPLCQRGDVCR
ncbi:MAG: hypothetical protein CFE26_09105 [Verrucomicrobiales bacterium VVV1]|nr:MAG: hypothetical protein CFE26_09105 [Verrucomicrobiales bacterium VVV1]